MAFFGFSLLSCHFWPFTGVLRKIFGSLTRKVSETFEQPLLRRLRRDRLERIAVEAAVSAALEKLQAARLPLQNYFGARRGDPPSPRLRRGWQTRHYFGASEFTIFSKHGSPRSGSHHGISFSSP